MSEDVIEFGEGEDGKVRGTEKRLDGKPPMWSDAMDTVEQRRKAVEIPKRTVDAAVQLKLAGASYSEIAQTLEYTDPAAVRVAVETAIAKSGDHETNYKTMRAMAALQIDGIIKSVAPRALDRDDQEHLAYARMFLSLIDRKAKLFGLDAPVRALVATPTAEEFDRVVQQVVGEIGVVQEGDIFQITESAPESPWDDEVDGDPRA